MAFKGLGQLRWEITVQTEGTSGNTTTWANTAAYAAIETRAAGNEGELGGHVVGQVQFILTMRNEVAITAKDRVVWGDKTLYPQSVRMLNLSYIEVLAVEHQ